MAVTYAIDRIVNQIRKLLDEPSVKAKYSDADLLGLVQSAIPQVLTDWNGTRDDCLIARHEISVQDGSTTFLLPPNVEQLLWIVKRDSENRVQFRIGPRAPTRFQGPGLRLEGRVLRFEPSWDGNSYTLELGYVPNGDVLLHYGTASSATSASIVFAAAPTGGSLDTRENAYIGSVVRIVSDSNGYVQERIVTAYDRTTRTAIVDPAFSPTPTGTILYEVVPDYWTLLETALALRVALTILAVRGESPRYGLLNREYQKVIRSIRVATIRKESIFGDYFSKSDWGTTLSYLYP